MSLAPVANDLDVFHPPPLRHDTDSWTGVVGEIVQLAQHIAGTEFVPKGIRNSIPATAAAMLYGREVGLPPMTALSSIHVIEGRPGMSSEAMRALVLAAGHDIAFDQTSGAMCKIRGRRAGSNQWTEVTWSIDQARAAGLLNRDNWRKYPRDMLIARATATLCRMIFPDVIHGFRTVEELADADGVGVVGPSEATASSNTTTVRRKSRKTSTPPPIAPPVPPVGEEVANLPPLPDEETPDPGSGEDTGGQTPAPSSPDPVPTAPPTAPPTPSTAPPEENNAAEEGDDLVPGGLANRPQLRMMFGQFHRLGLDDATPADREERLALISAIVGREVTSANELGRSEAQTVIVTISSVRDAEALRVLLARIDAGEADLPLPVEEPPVVGGEG